jgi:hypothetical protein
VDWILSQLEIKPYALADVTHTRIIGKMELMLKYSNELSRWLDSVFD